MYGFKLHCLDDLIKFNEKKYTWKMLFWTSAIFIFGFVEVILGAVIEYYSAGLFTHVAGACISEGVSDMMYAMNALHTGYFSFKQYANNKIFSLLISISTAGIAALVSRGVRVSRYGYKLCGNSSKNMLEKTGVDLMKVVGKDTIRTEIQKRILVQTLEAIGFGLASAQIDSICNKYISEICENVGTRICSGFANVTMQTDNHSISDTLKTMYNTFGKDQTKAIVNRFTQIILGGENNIREIVNISSTVISVIHSGVCSGINKRQMALNDKYTILFEITEFFAILIQKMSQALEIIDVALIMNEFLNTLNKELIIYLNTNNIEINSESVDDEYQQFQEELLTMWKTEFGRRTSNLLVNTVRSTLNGAVRSLYNCAKEYLKNRKKTKLNELAKKEIKQLHKEHQENLDNLIESDATLEEIEFLNKEFHKKIFKCLSNVTDPKIYAKLMMENIPMDTVCVAALVSLFHDLGIPRIQIIVERDDNDMEQTFGETGGDIIRLKLKDNHFYIEGDNTSNLGYDCLYDAIVKFYPELQQFMNARTFRQAVCDRILTDPEIHYTLSQNWQKYFVLNGGYGGAKRQLVTKEIVDISIRKNRVLTQQESQKQISEALNMALDNLNRELQRISKNPSLKVQPSDFHTTYVDTVLESSGMGSYELKLCPVEMKAEITVIDPKTKIPTTYTLELNIDNPTEANNGPEGAHVGYSLKGANVAKVAHIFIDNNPHIPDRGRGWTIQRNTNDFPEINSLFTGPSDTTFQRVTPTKNKENFMGYRFSFTPNEYGGYYHNFNN